jgi:hypothetical protein
MKKAIKTVSEIGRQTMNVREFAAVAALSESGIATKRNFIPEIRIGGKVLISQKALQKILGA